MPHKIGGKFEFLEFENEFVEPNFGAKIFLIMISEFQLWFNPLIHDQVQDSPLSMLRCQGHVKHEGHAKSVTI